MTLIADLLLSFVDVAVFSLDIFDPYGYYQKPINEYQAWRKTKRNQKSSRLLKEGYIKRHDTGYELTQKAKQTLGRIIEQDLDISRPEKWDGKWRIVLFDIPEQKRSARNSFRNKLQALGFEILQKSVLCFPHDCLKEIVFLTKYYDIEKYITYLEVTDVITSKDIFTVFSEKKIL